MRIVSVIFALLIFGSQQTATIESYQPNEKPSRTSVLQIESSLNVATSIESESGVTQGTSGAEGNALLAVSIWNDLNAMCRGGSGDRPETEYACCVRSKVSSLLNNLGYCYHMGDVWRKCTARDKRSARAALTSCVK